VFILEDNLIHSGDLHANKDIYFPNEIQLAARLEIIHFTCVVGCVLFGIEQYQQ